MALRDSLESRHDTGFAGLGASVFGKAVQYFVASQQDLAAHNRGRGAESFFGAADAVNRQLTIDRIGSNHQGASVTSCEE